ncbi:hypothetical protein [Photobacterium damselae]|uniref:hypothetical protein n=1 Tax=Photobacterium damselae TaxID=38293 RepID=UPI00083ADC00|nr:hypothetical protein [Photobacterium damselae]KAB1175036.1 hypothetical protein F6477_19600 [Photobacterium damselae subsp. damselae]NVO75316.1 hypothetical protein [Photobacterium damselae subsp. damselae]QSH59549.1 hypothetical protein A0J47_019925 [Photobacterium damselae subsp. damselae]SPY31312.1 Uncharacterised protein [Photobacterium damselae]
MKNEKRPIEEIKDEVSLSLISGAGYNMGPSIVWGSVMSGVKSCSWPAPFYGASSVLPTGSGLCSHH